MEKLLQLARMLRHPENGCPWDRAQTFVSFKHCLVEEAQEVVAAIDSGDIDNLKEELGDTLFNLIFLINLAEERGYFTMQAVIDGIHAKMIRRHPHVFGEQKAESPEDAYRIFQQAKQQARKEQNMSRDQAWQLLSEYTHSDSLQKHALAVEAAMAAYAEKHGQDVEKWRIVGLMHDLDYEKYPDEHPRRGVEILKQHGYSEEIQRAVLAHAEKLTGVTPQTLMEKTLYAVDELCGFIIAVALVRPNKKLAEVNLKSIKKKLKDKAFARAVDREEIKRGIELLASDPDQHIAFVLEALKKVAATLGL